MKMKAAFLAFVSTFAFAAVALAGNITIHVPGPPLPPLPPRVVVEPEPPPPPPTVIIRSGAPAYWFWSDYRRSWFYYTPDKRKVFVERHEFVEDGRHFVLTREGTWRVARWDDGPYRGWRGRVQEVEPEFAYPLPPTVIIRPGPPAYWFWSDRRRCWFYFDVDRRPVFDERHRFVDDGLHFFGEGRSWRAVRRDDAIRRGWFREERREHRRRY